VSSTLLQIADLIGHGVVDALAVFAEDSAQQQVFLMQLGYPTINPPSALASLPASLDSLITALDTLDDVVQDSDAGLASDADVDSALQGVLTGIGVVVAAIEVVSSSVASDLPDFDRRLYGFSLAQAIGQDLPFLYAFLVLAGIIEQQSLVLPDQADDLAAPSFLILSFSTDRLLSWFKSPKDALADVYGWGTPTIDTTTLFANLQPLLALRAQGSTLQYPTDKEIDGYALPTNADRTDLPARLGFPLAQFGPGVVNLAVTPVSPPAPATAQNLALTLDVSGQFSQTLALNDLWTFGVTVTADVGTGLGVLLVPGESPRLLAGILGDTSAADVNTTVQLSLTRTAPAASGSSVSQTQPILAIGDGSGVQAATVSLTLAASSVGGSEDLSFDAEISGGSLVIAPPSATFDAGLTWSAKTGVRFHAAGGLEVALPLHVTIGPVSIQSAKLKVAVDNGLDIAFKTDVQVAIGPVTGVVSDVGAHVDLVVESGNVGLFGVTAGPVLPSGVGLSIDAGSVHGGGFISFDQANSRYFGALQLSVYDIAVTAFGLIEAPPSGYSFVIVISAQFTPIQLGFGFTLIGVGGMVGINRSIDTNALASLVRAGQSEELLFPKNVISDAPTIVKDLTTVFPATQGKYVFGPLGKLGWGTPTLITGEIGIILEYPALVVVLLGEVKCLLPKPDQALVKLNLSIDGVLDFPNKTFSMDADLHDSVINGFPVSGQMAMRVSWGDQPNFVFSIGGFHPAYTPPPNFPKLQPMTLDLGSHGPAKINVSGFFAVTSNTVQVGGTATLHAGGSGITLDASVSVKALFVFQPFSFEADIDASVSVSFHGYGIGVHLSGTLDGPSPWHIKGEVCVSVLWWDACLGFDETFGGNTQITAPSVDPWLGVQSTDPTVAIVGLQTALSDPGNWSGALIPGTVSSVSRAQGTDTLVDPVGGLTVRQKTAPVETPNPLTKFGVAKTTTPISFSNVQATLGTASNTVSLTAVEAVNEDFAPAQFFDMDDGKKLSSAGFEQYQAGYLFGTTDGKNAQGGSSVTFQPKTRTLVINSDGSDTEFDDDYKPTDPQVAAFNNRSAVAKGGLALAGTRRFVNRAFAQSFSQVLPTFVITDTTTLAVPTTAPATVPAPAAAVRSATLIALDGFRAQHVELALGVQVTALHDMPT
jgi:hypothetical protein